MRIHYQIALMLFLMSGDGNNTNVTYNPLGECSSRIFDMMSNPTGSIKIYCDEKGFILQDRYAFSTRCHGGYETSRVPKEVLKYKYVSIESFLKYIHIIQ